MFVTLCEKRNELQKYLERFKIQTRIYYKTPLHLYKATKFLGFKKGDFPKSENYYDNAISIPIFQGLTIELQNEVVKVLKDKTLIFFPLNFKSLKSEFFIIWTLSSDENK